MIRGFRRSGVRFLTLSLILAFAIAGSVLPGQQPAGTGVLTGRIVNQGTGMAVPSATVGVKGTSYTATSDLSGVYRIENVPAGAYDVVAEKDGFVATTVTGVAVGAGEPTSLDVPLGPGSDSIKMEAFTVSADVVQSSDIGLLLARQKAVAVSDAIGSEQFGRLAVSDAAEAMSKVTGASVVDGKYVLIRGLGDRYANTLMNGVAVPTADPDKRAVQMDQFPSDLIESITTTKSFTPDQPGAFSGGSVNLKTKSFPEQLFVSFSTSWEYNDAATGEDLLTVDGTGGDVPDVPVEIPNRTVAEFAARGGDLGPAQELDRITKAFGTRTYFPHGEKADPNIGFSAAIGNRHPFGDQGLFGYTASVTYDRKFSHSTDGEANRYTGVVSAPQRNLVLSSDPSQLTFDTTTLAAGTPPLGVTSSTVSENVGAFAKLAVRPVIDHEFSLDVFFNRTVDDNVRRGVGEEQQNYVGSVFEVYDILYTERTVGSAQLAGKSLFPAASELELAWRLSYSNSTQDQPDYRTLSYVYDAVTGDNVNATGVSPNRYFRELDEDAVEGAIDLTYPFSTAGGREHRLKAGVVASRNERSYDEQRFQYTLSPRSREQLEIFPAPVGIVSSTPTSVTFGNTITRLQEPNKYEAEQDISAAYAMIDYAFTSKLRAIGGARFEKTEITTVPVRAPGLNPRDGMIDQTDALPALSFVYAATPKMNWRLAYGRTIARPTYKELTDIRYEDVFTDDVYVGNPDLELTVIDNVDLRWEWFPRKGETVAVSAFYKQLDQPIEVLFQPSVGSIQPQNVEEGAVYGVEFEYRRGLDSVFSALSDLSFGANLTFVHSEVTIPDAEMAVIRIDDPGADNKRELLGQSPYVFNADLTYDRRSSGTVATLSYNIVGERLDLVNYGSLPDVYEQPAGSLNLVVSQRLSDRWKLKLSAKNLLDPDHEKLIGFENFDLVYARYREGRTYSLSLTYLFE